MFNVKSCSRINFKRKNFTVKVNQKGTNEFQERIMIKDESKIQFWKAVQEKILEKIERQKINQQGEVES